MELRGLIGRMRLIGEEEGSEGSGRRNSQERENSERESRKEREHGIKESRESSQRKSQKIEEDLG